MISFYIKASRMQLRLNTGKIIAEAFFNTSEKGIKISRFQLKKPKIQLKMSKISG